MTAIGLAKNCQARLILVTVIPTSNDLSASNPMTPGASEDAWRKQAKKILGNAASLAREEDVKVETKTIENFSSPVHAIISYALDEKVDLVVVGTRGVGVVKRAPCSVLVVR
jgi:nucleotide-binding universal stress UspA family protein